MATKAEKEAAERAQAVAEKGLYAGTESDDNSVAVSDDGFIGVSEEYKNYSDDINKPLSTPSDEDEATAKVEEAVKASEEELARQPIPTNPSLTYEPDDTHPSERVKPQDPYIEGNRALMDAAVAQAQSDSGNTTTEEGTSPFDGDKTS